MVSVPVELWRSIVESHGYEEYDRGVGRDHSHCSSCDACNDGGCGKGTHKHKARCSWKKLDDQLKAVAFDELEEIVA